MACWGPCHCAQIAICEDVFKKLREAESKLLPAGATYEEKHYTPSQLHSYWAEQEQEQEQEQEEELQMEALHAPDEEVGAKFTHAL